MTPATSTAVLALAWFTVMNAVASLAALALSWRIADAITADATRSRRLLLLRFFPGVASLVVSVALFVPAHLSLEPANADERYGVVPLALAAIGAALLVRSVVTFARLVIASIHFAADVTHHTKAQAGVPFVEIPVLQGIALGGIVRPRVLVGSRARLALTEAELDVAIAHELAHKSAWDNLTRVVILCTPDFFAFMPAARRIERLWEAEAECLADARAVDGDAQRATTLASALVKAARIATRHGQESYAPGWSTFHHAELLETRVRLLVSDQLAREDRPHLFIGPLLGSAFVICVAWLTGLPVALHHVSEAILTLLP